MSEPEGAVGRPGKVVSILLTPRRRRVHNGDMTQSMSIQDIANDIANRFGSLDELDLGALHSDEGMEVEGVTVWHRTEGDVIVAFTNPNHPDEGEQWAEVLVQRPVTR